MALWNKLISYAYEVDAIEGWYLPQYSVTSGLKMSRIVSTEIIYLIQKKTEYNYLTKIEIMKKRIPIKVLMALLVIFAVACNQKAKEETVQEEPVTIVEVEEVDVWVIDEHQINDVPITSKAPVVKEAAKENE